MNVWNFISSESLNHFSLSLSPHKYTLDSRFTASLNDLPILRDPSNIPPYRRNLSFNHLLERLLPFCYHDIRPYKRSGLCNNCHGPGHRLLDCPDLNIHCLPSFYYGFRLLSKTFACLKCRNHSNGSRGPRHTKPSFSSRGRYPFRNPPLYNTL